jgi:hypothetical protein
VEKLSLLADFRDKLKAERNVKSNRVQGRNRKGVTLVQRDGSMGVGSYTIEYRQKLLARLLKTEGEFGEELISKAERDLIPRIWAEERADLAIKLEQKIRGDS